ncbi:MAG: nuclear transport factor 2 family protein [Novosphingobium sp.]|nr:nuclear transport factor 2 family protein [Novosphingobium sp.]
MHQFRAEMTRRFALIALSAGSAVSVGAPVIGAPASAGQASLKRAVEALRVAMVTGDEKALKMMLHDELVYMHSSGNIQTKTKLLGDLAGKAIFCFANIQGGSHRPGGRYRHCDADGRSSEEPSKWGKSRQSDQGSTDVGPFGSEVATAYALQLHYLQPANGPIVPRPTFAVILI